MFDNYILCIGRIESCCSEAQSCVVKSAQKVLCGMTHATQILNHLKEYSLLRELCPHTQVWLLFLCNKVLRDVDTALVEHLTIVHEALGSISSTNKTTIYAKETLL